MVFCTRVPSDSDDRSSDSGDELLFAYCYRTTAGSRIHISKDLEDPDDVTPMCIHQCRVRFLMDVGHARHLYEQIGFEECRHPYFKIVFGGHYAGFRAVH